MWQRRKASLTPPPPLSLRMTWKLWCDYVVLRAYMTCVHMTRAFYPPAWAFVCLPSMTTSSLPMSLPPFYPYLSLLFYLLPSSTLLYLPIFPLFPLSVLSHILFTKKGGIIPSSLSLCLSLSPSLPFDRIAWNLNDLQELPPPSLSLLTNLSLSLPPFHD